jgi:hypothetical protein
MARARNSVFSHTTASMRSATAQVRNAPHGALLIHGAGQMGANDLPPYDLRSPSANLVFALPMGWEGRR